MPNKKVEKKTTEDKKKSKPTQKDRVEKWIDGQNKLQDFLDTEIDKLNKKISALEEKDTKKKTIGIKEYRSMRKTLRVVRKKAPRYFKYKPEVKNTRKKPTNSGICKPTKISDELRTFIDKNIDTVFDKSDSKDAKYLDKYDSKADVARTFVTKFMCNYIRKHNLQDPEEKKNIDQGKDKEFDAIVYKFIEYDNKQPLTIFKMQRNLQQHYIKQEKEDKEKTKKEKASKKDKKEKAPKDKKEKKSKKATEEESSDE
jgi:hypothetical protein